MTGSPYLLVAEDDPGTARVITDLAGSLGWEVELQTDGLAALASFQRREPDLLLLDYYMPQVDGLEVLDRVRRAGSQVPVIIMTAAAEPDLVLEALRLGATDFLRKPFEHLLLLKVILRRESQRYRTRRVGSMVSNRIVSQAIEFELENDHSVASAIATHIASTMLRSEDLMYALRLGMEELLANAIEHGNLGLTLEDKTRALTQADSNWLALLAERAGQHPYRDRRVRVLAQTEAGCFEITIHDMGDGFDFNRLPDPLAEENLERPNGRGIYLARHQFDKVEYIGRGNVVKARKKIG